MTDSRVTPQAVQTAAAQLRATHWNGIGCGTYGASACSRCYGPSPADATEVAEEVLAAAAPLLCQPLQDEIDRLRAQIAAVERLHYAMHDGLSDRLGFDPYTGDICAQCCESWPCTTVAALAAVPVGTGSVDQCHNGHPFEPGIDSDMAAEGRTPDPRWCNVCGEGRRPVDTGNPTQPRADD